MVAIKALKMQLGSGEVIIPDLPMVRISAVFDSLQLNCSKYLFPESNFTRLLYHIITVDILGADTVWGYVGDKLCLPIGRFDLSNGNEKI